MLFNICFKHLIDLICAFIPWIKIYLSILILYKPKYIFKTLVDPLKFQIIFIILISLFCIQTYIVWYI